MQIRECCLLMAVMLVLASCSIAEHIGTIQVEVMRPGLLTMPVDADTLAVVCDKPDTLHSSFIFFNGRKLVDYPIQNFDTIFRAGADSLRSNLERTGYFRQTHFYDNLFGLSNTNNKIEIDSLFRKTKADVCVVLRKVEFDQSFFWQDPSVSSALPVRFFWNILFRNDSNSYIYLQADTLLYDYPVVRALVKNNNPRLLLVNAAGYMGKSCATKLIPNWMPVERMYYRSGNPEMRKAEKFAVRNDWLSAAEIWNRKSKSTNERLAAKAAFNMGLVCEMEGKPDLAIDWVLQAAKKEIRIDEDVHRENCQRYIIILNKRKRDLETLKHQIRQSDTSL